MAADDKEYIGKDESLGKSVEHKDLSESSYEYIQGGYVHSDGGGSVSSQETRALPSEPSGDDN